MTITHQDHNTLVINDKPWMIFIVCSVFGIFSLITLCNPAFFSNQVPTMFGWLGLALVTFILLNVSFTTITMDKTANLITFLRKKAFKKDVTEYTLSTIVAVELTTDYYKSGYTYSLYLKPNTGESIPLNPGNRSVIRVMGKQIVPERNTGAEIAHFLNVPFEERRPPTVQEMVTAVQSGITQGIADQKAKDSVKY